MYNTAGFNGSFAFTDVIATCLTSMNMHDQDMNSKTNCHLEKKNIQSTCISLYKGMLCAWYLPSQFMCLEHISWSI